jgi:hypothetical protein
MRQTDIRISLNSKGDIDKAITEIKKYKKRIEKRILELIDVMCEQGADYASIAMGHYDTGYTFNSIIGYREGNRGIIQAGGHSVWIEFGTGVKGQNSPHPSSEYMQKANWEYMVGKTIHTQPNGVVGWYYPADDGTWKFTQGLPSQHFMYDTARYVERKFKENAEKVFSK